MAVGVLYSIQVEGRGWRREEVGGGGLEGLTH